MAKPLSESEIGKFDWVSFSRDPFETAESLLATIRQDRKRIAELETALRAELEWLRPMLADAPDALTKRYDAITEVLTEPKKRTPETDLPSIEDVCGLWADEKDQPGG